MKKISLKMSNDFKIVPLCKNNIYALENNSAMIEIDCEVRSDLSYKLHIQSKNDKTVMLMDKGEHVITAMLKEPYISSNGVYYIQLEGVKSDYRIISNSIRFEVGSFINANHIPTPEEQGIIDQLVIRVGEVEEGLRIVELTAEEAERLARNAVPLTLYDEDMTQIDARINESTETINWFVTEFSATINDLFENIVRVENDVEGLQSSKQDTLVSGENIATINGHNLLDGGNIVIQGGGGSGMEYYKVTYDGTHILHNGVALTFNDVVAKYYDDNYFLYAEAYGLTMIPTLPPYEGDDILEFICTWIENGAVTISRLIINALNQVKFEDVEVAKKSDIPTVPTKTSELTNDSGFITARDVPAPYDDTEIRGEVSAVSEEVTQVKVDLSQLDKKHFVAQYGQTSYADISNALSEGRTVYCLREIPDFFSPLMPYIFTYNNRHFFGCTSEYGMYYAVVYSSNIWNASTESFSNYFRINEATKIVRTDIAQTLTDEQKSQAMANIGVEKPRLIAEFEITEDNYKSIITIENDLDNKPIALKEVFIEYTSPMNVDDEATNATGYIECRGDDGIVVNFGNFPYWEKTRKVWANGHIVTTNSQPYMEYNSTSNFGYAVLVAVNRNYGNTESNMRYINRIRLNKNAVMSYGAHTVGAVMKIYGIDYKE